jgi:hypothetical protein
MIFKRKQDGAGEKASTEQGGAEQAPKRRRGEGGAGPSPARLSSAAGAGKREGPRLPTACPVKMSAGARSPDVCCRDDATNEAFGLEL